MYKLTVINNKFRLFGRKETTMIYESKEELLEAVDNIENDKSFYITNENGKVIDIDEIRGCKPIEPVNEKVLETEYMGVKIRIVLTENKFNHEIKTKLEVDDKETLYLICLKDHKLFSKLELYDYFKRHIQQLKDLELACVIMSLIFD